MRIGVDISALARARTGVGNYCYYLVKHLVRQYPGDQFTGLATGGGALQLDPTVTDLARRHIHLPTRLFYLSWSMLGRPRADLLLGGLDVFHATNYFVPPVKSARRVVTFHDLAVLTRPDLCSPKIRDTFARSAGRFAREADLILACSHSTKADTVRLLDVDPEKVIVTHEAADDDFTPLEPEEARAVVAERYGVRTPYLLFVGTIEPRKNLPTLLEAFGRIAREIPHTLVLAGGPGWNSDPTYAAVDLLQPRGRVVMPGYVRSPRDLAALYSAADMFVFPSLYEGFGLPLVEAMLCGCPVVAADNSSIPEVTGDAALCVPAEDAAGFAEAIRSVLGDTSLRDRMAAAGRVRARQFSWESCARTTHEAYERAAREHP